MRASSNHPHWAAAAAGLLALSLAAGCLRPPVQEVVCERDTDCSEGSSCAGASCRPCPACGEGEVCIGATCVPAACGDSTCPVGQGCSAGRCVASECLNVSCGDGQQCVGGSCRTLNCAGQDCRPGEYCVDGRCTTAACFGIACPSGQECAGGQCVAQSCGGQICATGMVCVNGRCDDTRCVGLVCPGGNVCAAGACYPAACGGTACPPGEACIGGACRDVRCEGAQCPAGSACYSGACQPCPGGQCCTAPEPCGVGGACARLCTAGSLGSCLPPGGATDLQTDPAHCGECGNACPVPLQAPATCVAGTCDRGPCAEGYFDLDGLVTPGCEARCDGGACTLPDGGLMVIHSVLIPESGLAAQGLAGGTSTAGLVQTNAEHTHMGVLGEGVPLPASGAPEQANSSFRNQGGFLPAIGR